jgi:hypothetical protein
MTKRRFEILLPTEFNDGRLVADACPLCIPDSLSEVSDTFGAFTFRPDVALGSWTFGGMRYDDRLFLLSVDVEDTPSTAPGSPTSNPTCCNDLNNSRST